MFSLPHRYVASTIRLTLAGAVLGIAAVAAPAPALAAQDPPPTGDAVEEVPWPVRPGMRIALLRAQVPTVDRVVLVPDESAFLRALREWSLAGRWPVLIEDDVYAPMFIRRFQPTEVVRFAPVEEDEQDEARDDATSWLDAANEVIARTWSDSQPRASEEGDKAANTEALSTTPADAFAAVGWTSPGVVLTWENDRARAAAVALAADRGQPLVLLDERFGPVNRALAPDQWRRLNDAVEGSVRATGLDYAELGDAIDTITLVGDLAIKYKTDADAKDDIAVTDGLARHADGRRWAIAGSIFGSTERSVYQAMCAIFLRPDSALLFNTYPGDEGWAAYATTEAAASLGELNFSVEHIDDEVGASLNQWQEIAARAKSPDVWFVNTKGRLNWFDLSGGDRAFAQDVPPLAAPGVVYFIHSWSAAVPANTDTIAGRWLDGGAYLYVGAVHEPYLQAFITPIEISRRLRASIPFLIAARAFGATPWKVTTIGDPLMTLLKDTPRAAPESRPLENVTPLTTIVASATRDKDWPTVLRSLRRLGRDDLPLRTWRQVTASAGQADASNGEVNLVECADAAFEAIARGGTTSELLDAAETLSATGKLDVRRRDLVWMKVNADRAALNDADTLARLMTFVREPLTYVDATRLAPYVARRLGDAAADRLLDDAAPSAKDNHAKRLIRAARP